MIISPSKNRANIKQNSKNKIICLDTMYICVCLYVYTWTQRINPKKIKNLSTKHEFVVHVELQNEAVQKKTLFPQTVAEF